MAETKQGPVALVLETKKGVNPFSKKIKGGGGGEEVLSKKWEQIPLQIKQYIVTFLPLSDMVQVLLSGDWAGVGGATQAESKEQQPKMTEGRMKQLFYQYSHFVFEGVHRKLFYALRMLEKHAATRSQLLQRIEIMEKADEEGVSEEEASSEEEEESEEEEVTFVSEYEYSDEEEEQKAMERKKPTKKPKETETARTLLQRLLDNIHTLRNLQILHIDLNEVAENKGLRLSILPHEKLKQIILLIPETGSLALLNLFGSSRFDQLLYVDLRQCGSIPTDRFIRWMERNGVPVLETLIVRVDGWQTQGVLPSIAKHCPSIKQLTLESWQQLDAFPDQLVDEVQHLFRECKKLDFLFLFLHSFVNFKWSQMDSEQNFWLFSYANKRYLLDVDPELSLRLWQAAGHHTWDFVGINQDFTNSVLYTQWFDALLLNKPQMSVNNLSLFGDQPLAMDRNKVQKLVVAFPTLSSVSFYFTSQQRYEIELLSGHRTFKFIGNAENATQHLNAWLEGTKFRCSSLMTPEPRSVVEEIDTWHNMSNVLQLLSNLKNPLEELTFRPSQGVITQAAQEKVLQSIFETQRASLKHLSLGGTLRSTPMTMRGFFDVPFPKLQSVTLDFGNAWDKQEEWSLKELLKHFRGLVKFELTGLKFREDAFEFPNILRSFCWRNQELERLTLGLQSPMIENWPEAPNFPFELPHVTWLDFEINSNTFQFEDLVWVFGHCPQLKTLFVNSAAEAKEVTSENVYVIKKEHMSSFLHYVRLGRVYLTVSNEWAIKYKLNQPFRLDDILQAIQQSLPRKSLEKKAVSAPHTLSSKQEAEEEEEEEGVQPNEPFQQNMDKLSQRVIQQSVDNLKMKLLTGETQQDTIQALLNWGRRPQFSSSQSSSRGALDLFDGEIQFRDNHIWLAPHMNIKKIRQNLKKLIPTAMFHGERPLY
jgi:hypothetical protein